MEALAVMWSEDRNVHVNMEGGEIGILQPYSPKHLVFLFIDFNLCKSATEPQTNSP